MAPSCVLVGLVSPLILFVLFTGCEAYCSESELLTAYFDSYRALTFPIYYPDPSDTPVECGWEIRARRADNVVQLRVVNLTFGDTYYDCFYHSLNIYDSAESSSDRPLATLCTSDHSNKEFYSTGPPMFVRFKSYHLATGMGFELQYRAVKRWRASLTTTTPIQYVSGDTLMARRDEFQYFSSYGYPIYYRCEENFVWTIWAGSGEVIQLHVEDMNLETSDDCGMNTVAVYDSASEGESELARMCGVHYMHTDLYSTGDVVTIAFTSGFDHCAGRGFKLSYQALLSDAADAKATIGVSPTPSSSSDADGNRIHNSTVELIALGCGATLVLALLCIVVGYCALSKRRSRAQDARGLVIDMQSSTAGPCATFSNQRNEYGNELASRSHMPADNGRTNLAFCVHSEDPPPYSSLEHHPPLCQPDSDVTMLNPEQAEITPPSYAESMTTHPPWHQEADDGNDTLIQSATTPTSLSTGEVVPANPAVPDRALESVPGSESVLPADGVQQDAAIVAPGTTSGEESSA